MSWIGQSLAAHSISIAAPKASRLRRVTTGCPAATACGPTKRTMYTYDPVRAATSSQTSTWAWNRSGSATDCASTPQVCPAAGGSES